jgi:hypothetical protein
LGEDKEDKEKGEVLNIAKYIHGTTIFIDGGLTQNMGQGA